MPQASKTFRIFVSSTFSDLKAERNALQEHVFPRLRELCQQHGCRFQAIDLRWGVSEEASLDQQTMNICLEELKRCQRVTPRPNFIVLLGDRYGWRPLPPQIDAAEFEEVLTKVSAPDRALLLWDEDQPYSAKGRYRRDDNAVPTEYCLRPRHVDIPEHASDQERERAVEAEANEWSHIETKLQSIILSALDQLEWPKDDERRIKYEASATHQEILHGALKADDGESHVFCYLREIGGLPLGSQAEGFVDLNADGSVDPDSATRLQALKQELANHLPQEHIHKYHVQWPDYATEPQLRELCEWVERDLSGIINEEVSKLEHVSELDREIKSHAEFGVERARHFKGRRDILQRIEAYVTDADNRPLVIHGESGSGKTALMARATELCKSRVTDSVIVSRFIGATPSSSEIRSLLESLCREVAEKYGDDSPVPSEYRELVKDFPKRLGLSSIGRPLVIFLDALDQLSETGNARSLGWLPRELAPDVKLIASVLESEGPIGDCFDSASQLLPTENLVALGPLSVEHAEQVLDDWLVEAHRTLQPQQRQEVSNKFAVSPLPLFLKLAFEEARLWKSYDPIPDLSDDIPGIVRDLFARLEEESNHGRVLVSRSMAYLSAARYGLTEDELLDVLSADDEVISDFRQRSPRSPEADRLPVVVWSRLYFDLEPYLTERRADQISLLTFYHRQFHETVTARYLRDPELRERHRTLATYFAAQPFESSEGRANQRVLSVLAFHLLQGQDLPGLSRLVRSPFLELKARTVGEPEAADDARQIATALANGDDEYWDDLITCARIHCAIVERIQANPESLEEIISRGEVARVRTLIRAEPDESRRALIALAASALLHEGGHREAGTRLFEEHAPILTERLRLDLGQESDVYRGHALAYGFEVHCIARTLVESFQGTRPQSPPTTPGAVPHGSTPQLGVGLSRTNVPLFDTALALLASDRTAGVMTLGLLGLLFAAGLVLALITPDSFPLRLSTAGKILSVSALFAMILAPFTLSAIAGKLLSRTGRTDRILSALANGWRSAAPPEQRNIGFRALRYESVVGRSAEEGRSSPPLGDLVARQLDLARDPTEIADILLALPASDEGLVHRVLPVLRHLPSELLDRVYRDVQARTQQLRSKWQLLRILVGSADRAFHPELLLHCVISKDSEVQRYGLVGDLQPTIAELRWLSLLHLARLLLFTLRVAATKPSRRERMARWWAQASWRAFEPLRAPFSGSERLLWIIMLLPAYLGAALLGIGLVTVAAAMFGGIWVAGRMHDAYRVTHLLRNQPAWPHRAEIEESADQLGLWFWETGSLRRGGMIAEAILARAILTGESVEWSVDTNTSKLRAHRVLTELVRNDTVERRGDLVVAAMGNRRLLEAATAMSSRPHANAPRRFGLVEHERNLRRALPRASAWSSLAQVLVWAAVGTITWSTVLRALQPGGPVPRDGSYVAAALFLSAVLAILQHLGRRPLNVERDDPTLWYGFRGVLVFIAYSLLAGYVVTRLRSDHGLTTPDTRVMIELLISPLLLTNLLVPEVIAACRGAGLIYPRYAQLAWRRFTYIPLFAVGCLAVALLVAGLGSAVAAIERAFAR